MKFLLLLLSLTSVLNANAALKLAQYNIRNFDYDERARIPTNKNYLSKTIKEMNPDFMTVQEIRETEVFEEFIDEQMKGKYGVALSECGGAHGQRLGFVYNTEKIELVKFTEDLRTSNPKDRRNQTCHDGSRPLAIGLFKDKTRNKLFVGISVHLKSGGQANSISKRFAQLDIINSIVADYKAQGINDFVIMGDFNSTEYIYKGKEYEKFKSVVNRMGLKDLSKDMECSAYWWGGMDDGKQHPSLLDHMLVSPDFIDADKKETATAQAEAHCKVLRCQATWEDELGTSFDQVSDHCPLTSNI